MNAKNYLENYVMHYGGRLTKQRIALVNQKQEDILELSKFFAQVDGKLENLPQALEGWDKELTPLQLTVLHNI